MVKSITRFISKNLKKKQILEAADLFLSYILETASFEDIKSINSTNSLYELVHVRPLSGHNFKLKFQNMIFLKNVKFFTRLQNIDRLKIR
jgi:hypothetical protein